MHSTRDWRGAELGVDIPAGRTHPMNSASAVSCVSGAPLKVANGGGSGCAGMQACTRLAHLSTLLHEPCWCFRAVAHTV